MKSLFKVVDSTKRFPKVLATFSDKQEAKLKRNELNKDSKNEPFRVFRGKDHWRGESFPDVE